MLLAILPSTADFPRLYTEKNDRASEMLGTFESSAIFDRNVDPKIERLRRTARLEDNLCP